MKMRLALIILFVAVLGFLGYILYPVFNDAQPGARSNETPATAEGKREVLLGVVVENSLESRPHSGLSLADFVFETVTEGGITRFVAFYEKGEAEKIGPVRSARPYFVDWAYGFGAAFAHAGASKEALRRIEQLTEFRNIDEFFNTSTFWRDQARKAPHNLYTSTDNLKKFADDRNWEPAGQLGWQTKKESVATTTPQISEIFVDFSFPIFGVTYEYNSEKNSYDRFVAGKADIDHLGGKQISVNNVVVLYSQSSVIDQKLLTINLQTLGSGRALIFRDGQMVQARWKKDSVDAPLKLLDADDSLIELNPGNTWFAVIDQLGTVTWK